MNGTYSRYTNPSKFLDHEDISLRNKQNYDECIVYSQRLRNDLKGKRVLSSGNSDNRELVNAFRL